MWSAPERPFLSVTSSLCLNRRLVISVEVDDADLREIAIAGYPEAVSTDRIAQGKAVSLFLPDSING
jgi:hypothetical protein